MGVDLTGHRSRPLSHTEPATFDLVLGFELDHVAVAFAEHGVPADRAFLLTEFVRLAASDVVPDGSEDHARAVIESAGRCRSGNFQPDEEVEDPIGKNRRAYETAGREIDHLTQELVPLPEGWQYLGFIFARAESADAVEQALRTAHAQLSFDIE